MARLALPSSTFSDVQRYLRHKRATGQTVSPREERSAWAGYWDAMAARQMSSRRLSLEERRLDEYTRLAEEKMEREEEAAKISGITELGTTALLGGYVLKGTELGAKIGLGTGIARPGGGVKATAPITALPTAAPTTGAGAALIATEGVGPTATEMGGAAFEEFAMAPVAEKGAGMMSAITPMLGPAVAGYAAGGLSKMVPIGAGKTTGRIKGTIAGAGAGFAMGGPGGAIIGAITGFMGGGK